MTQRNEVYRRRRAEGSWWLTQNRELLRWEFGSIVIGRRHIWSHRAWKDNRNVSIAYVVARKVVLAGVNTGAVVFPENESATTA